MTNENNTAPTGAPKSIQSSLAIPVAIVLGFGLIALSIYFSGGGKQPVSNVVESGEDEVVAGDIENINPITDKDHIRGNPNAPLVIVEYSDYDCPFCKSFHATLSKIMDEYGPSGKVAWVYRHYPITSLHPSAVHLAEASECVAELAGNDAFWKFSDLIFGERGTNELTDISRLPEFAVSAGVSDETGFQECLDSERNRSLVEEDFSNGIATGGRGTPHSIILIGDQKLEITGGARPYEEVKLLIDRLLE